MDKSRFKINMNEIHQITATFKDGNISGKKLNPITIYLVALFWKVCAVKKQ